jgi:hypothetical protein
MPRPVPVAGRLRTRVFGWGEAVLVVSQLGVSAQAREGGNLALRPAQGAANLVMVQRTRLADFLTPPSQCLFEVFKRRVQTVPSDAPQPVRRGEAYTGAHGPLVPARRGPIRLLIPGAHHLNHIRAVGPATRIQGFLAVRCGAPLSESGPNLPAGDG